MRLGISISIPGMAQAAAWTPANLSSGASVLFWGIVTDANVTRSSGNVTQWNDLSGNDNHFTGTSAKEPSYDATGWTDGSPAIYFDGGEVLENNNTDAPGNNHWMWVRCDPDAATGGPDFIYSVGPSGGGFVHAHTGNVMAIFDAAYKTAGSSAAGEQVLLYIADSGGSPKGAIYRDGTSLGSLSSDYDGTMSPDLGGAYPIIGANATSGAVGYLGFIKEILVGNGQLSAADLTGLLAYTGT